MDNVIKAKVTRFSTNRLHVEIPRKNLKQFKEGTNVEVTKQ